MRRGRPPIGDKAMSSAERQRRFLDRIRGTGAADDHPSLLEAECAKLEAECAKLKNDNTDLKRLLEGAYEHIRKLEARRERPHPQPKAQPISGDGASEMEQKLSALRRKNAELRRLLREVARAPSS
jgi:predicted RNase H-like nuclease (RuvC/YqgF family)